MLIPPESKQTPLPTSARCRPSASFAALAAGTDHDHPRRVGAPLPDGEEHAHPKLGSSLLVQDIDPQAVSLGDGAGLVGEDLRRDVVGRAVCQAAGDVGALADDPAALRGGSPGPRPASAPDHEDQLAHGRRGSVGVLAVDRLGLEAPLDDPPDHELRGEGRVAAQARRDGIQPHGHHVDIAVDHAADRGRRQAAGGLAVEGIRGATGHGKHPLDPDLARRRHGRGIAGWPELAERGQGPQLAAGPAVKLVEQAGEGGLAHDGNDEQVGGDRPRLRSDNADLHEGPPVRLAASGALERACAAADLRRNVAIECSADGPPDRPRLGADQPGGSGAVPSRSCSCTSSAFASEPRRLLDRDHGLVQSALGDIGHDHDQAPRVSRKLGASLLLALERLANGVGDPGARLDERPVQVPQRGVVGGIALEPRGQRRHVRGPGKVVAKPQRFGDGGVAPVELGERVLVLAVGSPSGRPRRSPRHGGSAAWSAGWRPAPDP